MLVSVEQGEGGGRSPKAEKGKKMVRFLVIIFDGASEDVPNEDLTLIKDDSLSLARSLFLLHVLSLSHINDKTIRCVVMAIRVAKQRRKFANRPKI